MPNPRFAENGQRPLASMSELVKRTHAAYLTHEAAKVVLDALDDVQYSHRSDTKEREIEPKTSYLIQPSEGSAYAPKFVNNSKKHKLVTRKHPFRAESCEVIPGDSNELFVTTGDVALVYEGNEGKLRVPAVALPEIEIFEMREGEVFSVWPPQAEVPAVLTAPAEAIH